MGALCRCGILAPGEGGPLECSHAVSDQDNGLAALGGDQPFVVGRPVARADGLLTAWVSVRVSSA